IIDALSFRLTVQSRKAVATRVKALTYDVFLGVLAARTPRSGRPACALLGDWKPHLLMKTAPLWARVLCNRPRRGAALRALSMTLYALGDVGATPMPVIEEFGRKVGEALPPAERPLLRTPLTTHSNSAAARPSEGAGHYIDAFLTAVASPTNQPAEPSK